MKKIELTQEQISQILNLYKNNYSQQKIANILEVSRPVIKRVLTENEVLLRERTHKYKADYDIFENIDTPEKAYWLGFIAADGCNY
jgi:predicted transcriptional regulator